MQKNKNLRIKKCLKKSTDRFLNSFLSLAGPFPLGGQRLGQRILSAGRRRPVAARRTFRSLHEHLGPRAGQHQLLLAQIGELVGVLYEAAAHLGKLLLLFCQAGILLADNLVLLVDPLVQVHHLLVLGLHGGLVGVCLAFEIFDEAAGLLGQLFARLGQVLNVSDKCAGNNPWIKKNYLH